MVYVERMNDEDDSKMNNKILFFSLFFLCSYFSYVNSTNTTCLDLRDSFADAIANFTSCAIYNSRPITLCEDCVEIYMNVIQLYTNLSMASSNGTKCIDQFTNLDRLQILESLYSNTRNLWIRAKCYECFETENDTLSPNPSNETIWFNKYYNNLTECINRSDLNDTTLCNACMDDYLILDGYYDSISNENERIGVCMDIVDLMNTTRTFWSTKCCKYRKHSENIFLISTALVVLITAIFYILAQSYGEKKPPAILQQSRFAESRNHVNIN